jgi:hypothetical protein
MLVSLVGVRLNVFCNLYVLDAYLTAGSKIQFSTSSLETTERKVNVTVCAMHCRRQFFHAYKESECIKFVFDIHPGAAI